MFGFLCSRFQASTRELWCYNAVIADSRLPSAPDMQLRCSILSPELALPTGQKAVTTRSHAALHILGKFAFIFYFEAVVGNSGSSDIGNICVGICCRVKYLSILNSG